MKRLSLLIIVALLGFASCGQQQQLGVGHNSGISCNSGGQVVVSASNYGQAKYSLNGAPDVSFTGGFSLVLNGNSAQHVVITADDWPTQDLTAGPCVQPTTSTTKVTVPDSTTTTSTICVDCVPNTVRDNPTTTTTTICVDCIPTQNSTIPSSTTTTSSVPDGTTTTTCPLCGTTTTTTTIRGVTTTTTVPGIPTVVSVPGSPTTSIVFVPAPKDGLPVTR